MVNTQAEEREQARAYLIGEGDRLRHSDGAALLVPGDTIYTILRHCSASGMTRWISLVVARADGGAGDLVDISWQAARVMGSSVNIGHDGIKIGGAGMDMGFALVYDLGRYLYRDGVPCAGERRCQSNDHVNSGPDRNTYGPGVVHRDGGYAFRQRWL